MIDYPECVRRLTSISSLDPICRAGHGGSTPPALELLRQENTFEASLDYISTPPLEHGGGGIPWGKKPCGLVMANDWFDETQIYIQSQTLQKPTQFSRRHRGEA